jgi:hypothetical protein
MSNDLKKATTAKENDCIHLREGFNKASANRLQAGGVRRER